MSEAEIRDMSARRARRIGRREFDAMVEDFYGEEALLMPSAAASVRGREDIRAFWRATPEQGLVSLSLETTHVEASGELAYEIGRFSRTLRPRHGAPFQETGKYVIIYRQGEAGRWRAVAEMFNSDAPR